jgi:hypothetical protein
MRISTKKAFVVAVDSFFVQLYLADNAQRVKTRDERGVQSIVLLRFAF